MNKLFTKIVGAALGLTMAIGVGVAVASNSEAVPVHAATGSLTVTASDLGYTNTTYNNKTGVEVGSEGFKFSTTDVCKQTGTGVKNFQLKKTSGYLWNSDCPSGYTITSIQLTNKSGGSVTVKKGSSAKPSTTVTAGSNDTYTINDKYFGISGPSAPAYFTLVINYSSGATKLNTPQPTYNNSTKQVTWSAILNASSYQVKVDSGSYATATSPYSVNSLSTGVSHTVYVVAKGDGTNYSDSDAGSVTFTPSAPKTPGSLSSTGQATSFEAGDTFEYGGTLTATYTDSTSKTVTPDSFKIGNAGINPTSAGTVITPGTTVLNKDDHHGKTVYVLYTENATTVYTSYTISVAAVNKVTFTGGTDTGTAGGAGQSDSLTKSGVTMACGSCYTTSGAYRFYSGSTLTISSTVGNIAQIEFNMNESYNSNLLSTSTGTYNSSDSTKGIWTGDAASIDFGLSAQARVNSIVITLASNDPTVELDATSATEVSMMRGDTDTSVKVLVKNIDSLTWNFTFDEDEDEGLTTSSYISVSASALISNVSTLTITTKAVGSTTMHISVSGTACETTVPVAVATKPASMAVVHGDISEGHLEIQTGTYKQVSFSGLDTDGNPYSIAAGDVTPSVQSGNSYVELSGSRITAKAEGTAVVRYTLKALTSVYAEVTVDVVDDYKTTVNSITFNSNLSDTQGDAVDTSAVFATKVANTHFGSTQTIADSELLFSYENNRSGAETINVFPYDFSHGTTVDSTHKSQTIYVFTTFDESYSGSFTITIEQKNDPLTAIAFTNVTNNEVDVTRGSTFQLEWAYTPTNPTDGKEVEFIIDDISDGIDITVSSTGLISIGASSDLGTALVLIQSAHDDTIQDHVYVSAVLGSMKYTVSEAVSWAKVTDDSTLSAGDVIMVASDAKGKVLGEFSGSNKYANEGTATFSDGSASSVTGALEFTLETGSSSGTWNLKNGTKYLYGTSSKTTLCLSNTASDITISISSGDATIDFGSSCRILHNVNVSSTRFSNYTSDTSSSMLLPQIYLKSGGDVQMDVTETLFNGVHNNFGAGKTYEWSDSCPAFDEDAWLDACVALTKITNYSSYKLNRAVGNIAGNEVEQFIAKYDIIIGKFGTTHDHLDRYAQGGINYGVSPLVNIIGENTNTVAIIVIISMVSVTAIGGYFFLRKRKEN